ncbi:hypothetical protein DVR09_11285 [Erythrobacter aureus]|uniref:Tetratricopeptide repeat protein n=1 Tax=Erythrobacter aureus TaxID=2182384 RepID=A0A345YFY0_9SPHN|nr:hypothetical protein DVR09_11285 [Erythrobacter aureus]
MKPAHPVRLAVLSVSGLALAAALAVQSAGIALARKSPDLAVELFPLNGLALERLATVTFLATSVEGGGADLGPLSPEELAATAYRNEPLVPEAQAILALSEQDEKARSRIVALASRLDRREPRLQAVVLQEQVAALDYPGAIATLDRILRVRPSRSQDMFPTLLAVFVQDGAVAEFARILDGSSPWHQAFFEYAVKQPEALRNLLALRGKVSFDHQELDQELLSNLVKQGEVTAAFRFYEQIASSGGGGGVLGALSWSSAYAPFEWSFSDEAGLRAQPSLDGKRLNLSVKPGRGGVVARRLIKAPEVPFVVQVEHDIRSPQSVQDINIVLQCANDGTAIVDANLARQGEGYEIGSLPSSCAFVEILVEARAWSGRSALNAELVGIRIVT